PPATGAPVLTSMAPATIAQGQTRNVVLTGSRFDSTCSVLAAGLAVLSRAAAPAGATTVVNDSPSNAIGSPRGDCNVAPWSKDQVTIVAGAGANPTGVAGTASKIVESTGVFTGSLNQTITGVAGQSTAIEIYVQALERTWARIGSYDNPGEYRFFVDLTAGVAYSTNTADVLPTVVSLGGGKVKIRWIHVNTGSSNLIYVAPATGNGDTSHTGDGVSGILFSGMQAEKNATTPSFDMFGPSPAVTASPSIDSATQITASVTAANNATVGNHAVIVRSSSNGDSAAVQLAVTSGAPNVPTAGNATSATASTLTFPVTLSASGPVPTKIRPYFYNGSAYVANSYGNADIPVTVAQGGTQNVTLTALPASTQQTISFSAANAIGISAGAANVTGTTSAQGAVTPTTMKFVPIALNAPTGGSNKVTPQVLDQSGNVIASPSISYVSANTAIATVDASGNVAGVAVGQTTVTVTSGTVSKTVIVQIFDAATGAGIMGSSGVAPFVFESVGRFANDAAFAATISSNLGPGPLGGRIGTATSGSKYSDGSNVDQCTVIDAPDLGTTSGFGRCFKNLIRAGSNDGLAPQLVTGVRDLGLADGAVTSVVMARRALLPTESTGVGDAGLPTTPEYKLGPMAFWKVDPGATYNGEDNRFSIFYDGGGNGGGIAYGLHESGDTGIIGNESDVPTYANNAGPGLGSANPVMAAGVPYDIMVAEKQFVLAGVRYWEVFAYYRIVGGTTWEQWGPRQVEPYSNPKLARLQYWTNLTGLPTYNEARNTPIAWYITEAISWNADTNSDPLGAIAQTASRVPDDLGYANVASQSGTSATFNVGLNRYAGSLRAKVNGTFVSGQDFVIARTQGEAHNGYQKLSVQPTLTGLPTGTNTVLWYGVSRDGSQVSAAGASCTVTI
ncbi:MAG: phage head spike fiber domain-containing protein, partial [Gemmatimonadaceae bacterium]